MDEKFRDLKNIGLTKEKPLIPKKEMKTKGEGEKN